MQNGKFSAGAAAFVNTLKNVDFLQREEKASYESKAAVSALCMIISPDIR